MQPTYRAPNTNPEDEADLHQGDVLARTPELVALLDRYHTHYAHKPDNSHFIVLTQSCDLARRGGAACKAPYISLAPVRPLSHILDKLIAASAAPGIDAEIAVCTERKRNKLYQFLERLLNNNETSYFYLRPVPEADFREPGCGILGLPISLRAQEHYATMLAARLFGLDDTFQAKLGWLVGQLFSRVGTKDWPQKELKREIHAQLDSAALWVDDKKLNDLKRLVSQWRDSNPGAVLDDAQLTKFVDQIRSRKERSIERIKEIVSEKFPDITPQQLNTLTQKLKDDETLTTLLK